MREKTKNILKKILLVIPLITLLSSCHSEFLNLEIKTDGTIAWNRDGSSFAFVAETRLYKMPEGISKFPDGGKSKNEYLDFSIYKYDIKTKRLSRLTDLNEFYIANTYHWLSISQVSLSLNDTALYYEMKYPYDYDLKNIKKRRPEILTNIIKTYKIDLITLQKDEVNTIVFKHLFDKKRVRLKASVFEKYLSGLKCKDWGIDIQKVYQQPKGKYINYIVERQGNTEFMECIFNQIVPNFTEGDRKIIIEKMKKHKQKLYKEFDNYDAKKDPYRKSMAKSKYDDYIEYMEHISKLLLFKQKED